MEKKELIGRKVVGFIFDPREYPTVPYRHDYVLACVGWKGEIVRYDVEEDSYLVSFPSNRLMVHYPAVLIGEEVIDEEEEPKAELKVGDWVRGFETVPKSLEFCRKYIGYIGEVVRIESDINIVHVKFHDGEVIPYPLDQALEHRAGNNDTTYTVSDLKFDNGFYKNENKSSGIDYGKIEDDPLDSLPLIGDGVLMEVSHDGHEWFKAYVLGKRGDYFFAWYKEDYDDIWRWKHARPIQKTKITRKEFESKFEIID